MNLGLKTQELKFLDNGMLQSISTPDFSTTEIKKIMDTKSGVEAWNWKGPE